MSLLSGAVKLRGRERMWSNYVYGC